MSKSLTIKNIKTIMEGVASEHIQIQTILKGNIWDVDLTKDVSGVYLIYEIVNIAPNGFNGIDYSIDIFICDNVTEINTDTNEVSVQSECSLIALDIMSIFENYNKATWSDKDVMLSLNKNWSIQPFAERFDSLYAGAAINMSLSSAYGYSRCQVPNFEAPTITGLPTLSGVEIIGETLTALAAPSSGQYPPVTSWQWQRSNDGVSGWNDIDGEVSNTYILADADNNKFVRVMQTETNTTGVDSANSASSGEIITIGEQLFNYYSTRVLADLGIVENDSCTIDYLNEINN